MIIDLSIIYSFYRHSLNRQAYSFYNQQELYESLLLNNLSYYIIVELVSHQWISDNSLFYYHETNSRNITYNKKSRRLAQYKKRVYNQPYQKDFRSIYTIKKGE